MTISDEHRAYLRDHAISDHTIDAVCETTRDGLAFDLVGVTGRQARQIRLDSPRDPDTKYLGPAGEPSVISVPPGYRPLVDNTAVPLVIAEGTKGHLAAADALRGASPSVAVVGLLGCWGWSHDSRPTDELLALPVAGREVVVLLDADFHDNRQVWEAASALRDQLTLVLGASSVKFMNIPGRDKESSDDMLSRVPEAARQGTMLRIIAAAKESLGKRPAPPAARNSVFDARGNLLAATATNLLLDTYEMAVTEEQSIAVYKDGVYHNGRSKMFNEIVLAMLGEGFRNAHLATLTESVITRLQTMGRIIPERPDRLLINCLNGLVDPLTGTLHPHDPEFMTLSQIQVAYDPDATCPRFDKWIEERLPGQRDALLEVMSTALDPTWTPTKALFNFGPSRSGKSTVLRLLAAVVGKNDTSAVTLHQLSEDSFASANVYGKRLNVAADLSSSEIRDLSAFKMMTGEDKVNANRKYGQQFTFTNQALFAFSANEVPQIGEGSDAYLARMMPFHFANSFKGTEDAEVEKELMEELSGLFRALVEALGRFVARGRIYPEPEEGAARQFAAQSDKVLAFLQERTERSEVGTERSVLFEVFKDWCNHNNRHWLGKQKFFDRVTQHGINEIRKGKNRVRAFDVVVIDPEKAEAGSFAVNAGKAGSFGPYQPPAYTPSDSDVEVIGDFQTETARSARNGSETGSDQAKQAGKVADRNCPQTARPEPKLPAPDIVLTEPAALCILAPFVALDVETTGVGPDATIRTVQLGWEGKSCVLVLHDEAMRNFARQILPMLDGKLWAYTNFDRRMLSQDLGLDLTIHDAAALHHLVDQAGATSVAPLKNAIEAITGFRSPLTAEQTIALPTDDPDFLAYAGLDASGLSLLLDSWLTGVDTEFLYPWLEREQRISDVCHEMQERGMLLDLATLDEMEATLNAEVERLSAEVEALYPGLNPGSPKQLEAAYTERGVELPTKRRKRKDGTVYFSTSTSYKDLSSDDPLVVAVNSLKKAQNSLATITGWRGLLGEDGKIHARFNPLGARTSRWSSSNPNLQNVSKRDGDVQMRAPFVAPDGFVIVQADLSQIEYRVAAALSGDEAMLAAFAAGEDLHVYAAKALNGVDTPTKEQRSAAKGIGFGKLYGQSPRTAAKAAGVTEDEMAARVAAYDAAFPQLHRWTQEVQEYAENHNLLTPVTPYGRRFKVSAAYQAVNYTVQSTAREVFVDWVFNIYDAGLGEYLVAGVHDEVVLVVPAERAEEVRDAVIAAASAATIPGHPVVDIVAEGVVAGRSWQSAYEGD